MGKRGFGSKGGIKGTKGGDGTTGLEREWKGKNLSRKITSLETKISCVR